MPEPVKTDVQPTAITHPRSMSDDWLAIFSAAIVFVGSLAGVLLKEMLQ